MAGSQAARFLSAGTLAQRTGSDARCSLAEASLPPYWRIASKLAILWQILQKTMTPRRKISRRRAAANSLAAKRLDDAVFYLDKSIHSRLLLKRMRECGATVEHAGGAFPCGTQDEVWLAACGERGWIVLTRDKRIRWRVLEREAIRLSGRGRPHPELIPLDARHPTHKIGQSTYIVGQPCSAN